MTIFHDAPEYQLFLRILRKVKDEMPFVLYAYCLMPNHIHLLLKVDGHPLSDIMQRLLATYSLGFNARRDRPGHVFQGRYKAIACAMNRYFYALLRYIHINPVQAGLSNDALSWPWSSHRQYALGDDGLADVSDGWACLETRPDRARSFYAELLESPIQSGETDWEKALAEECSKVTLEFLGKEVAATQGLSVEELRSTSRGIKLTEARTDLVRRARENGIKAVWVARFLNISQAAVSQLKKGA